MVEITFPIVLQIVQTVALIVGIVYYITIMRNTQKTRELTLKAQEQATETRQAQLSMQLVNGWSQPHLVEARAFYQHLGSTSYEEYLELWQNPETEMQMRQWGSYCEGLGVLVRENYLDIKIVAGLVGGVVKSDWEKIRGHTYKMREVTGFPRTWIEWEYLYNALMKYAEENPERSIQEVTLVDSWKEKLAHEPM
jgi:hypothetical protein